MAAKPAAASAKRYLLSFLLWSALFGLIHFTLFPAYAEPLLWLTQYHLTLLLGQPIDLMTVPGSGIYGSHGFLLMTPAIPQPVRYPHDLYSITLNFMFAPALVMTTLQGSANAAWRALLAAIIILLLHMLHLMTIALYFPLTRLSLPNPIIGADFPEWLAAFVRWNYTFTDKMGYTLFPFVAWFAVCFKRLVELFSKFAGRRPGGDEGTGARRDAN